MTAMSRKIVLPGGSGFLGKVLAKWFGDLGWDVVVLTRRPGEVLPPARGGCEIMGTGSSPYRNSTAKAACGEVPVPIISQPRSVAWDGKNLGEWSAELEGAAAVVNLAGRSVNCRYHDRNRRAIMASRVESTRVLGAAIRQCATPPVVWLNSSTATIYQHTFEQPMDEATGVIAGTPAVKDVFSIEVARAWEQALAEADVPDTRKVALRTAMVLGVDPGGVWRVLRRLVRSGLGGAMGDGRQFVSWIHETDFCRAVQWLIERDDLSGPVNLAAPDPLPNRELMRLLRETCGPAFGLPASRWMLKIGAWLLGTETELILKSRRVIPGRLIDAGFEFRFPDLQSALVDLERRYQTHRSSAHRAHNRSCA